MKRRQLVTIKGTKNGLTLHLNDDCSYEELLKEFLMKLNESSSIHEDKPDLKISIELGNRYVTAEQKEEIVSLVETNKNFFVQSINSNIVTKKEAEEWIKSQELQQVHSIVRSGQVIEVPGDLLLIGDVNPGGTVKAGGNIYILGQLKGVAHAGYNGNTEAVVVASVMKPTQLRISNYIREEITEEDWKDRGEMEYAYIHNNVIELDRLKALSHSRSNVMNLEGGI